MKHVGRLLSKSLHWKFPETMKSFSVIFENIENPQGSDDQGSKIVMKSGWLENAAGTDDPREAARAVNEAITYNSK